MIASYRVGRSRTARDDTRMQEEERDGEAGAKFWRLRSQTSAACSARVEHVDRVRSDLGLVGLLDGPGFVLATATALFVPAAVLGQLVVPVVVKVEPAAKWPAWCTRLLPM